MKSSIIIKQATLENIPLILQFIKELAEYEKMHDEVVVTETLLKESLFGENAHTSALIAYYAGEVAGFAVFFHNYSTFHGRSGIYLEDLYVKSDMRGKGIGKQLLIHLAKLAKARNCARLEWSVLDWNESAIQFYKSLGAKPMNQSTVFRLTDKHLDELAEQS